MEKGGVLSGTSLEASKITIWARLQNRLDGWCGVSRGLNRFPHKSSRIEERAALCNGISTQSVRVRGARSGIQVTGDVVRLVKPAIVRGSWRTRKLFRSRTSLEGNAALLSVARVPIPERRDSEHFFP
jgi:hypothetical protein